MSILNTDLYKLTMQQAVLELYPKAHAVYKFINRRPENKFNADAIKGIKADVNAMQYQRLYDDEKNLLNLLRSIDRFSKEDNWFRSFCGPSSHSATKLLTKLGWFDGTIKPYQPNQKDIGAYCGNVMKRVAKESKGLSVCCMDFILGDIGQHSLKQAITIEAGYNKNRISGLMFCPYQTKTLLDAGIEHMMDLFAEHDQIFVLKGDELHKLHVTKENTHKLFMN